MTSFLVDKSLTSFDVVGTIELPHFLSLHRYKHSSLILHHLHFKLTASASTSANTPVNLHFPALPAFPLHAGSVYLALTKSALSLTIDPRYKQRH